MPKNKPMLNITPRGSRWTTNATARLRDDKTHFGQRRTEQSPYSPVGAVAGHVLAQIIVFTLQSCRRFLPDPSEPRPPSALLLFFLVY